MDKIDRLYKWKKKGFQINFQYLGLSGSCESCGNGIPSTRIDISPHFTDEYTTTEKYICLECEKIFKNIDKYIRIKKLKRIQEKEI